MEDSSEASSLTDADRRSEAESEAGCSSSAANSCIWCGMIADLCSWVFHNDGCNNRSLSQAFRYDASDWGCSHHYGLHLCSTSMFGSWSCMSFVDFSHSCLLSPSCKHEMNSLHAAFSGSSPICWKQHYGSSHQHCSTFGNLG